MACKGGALAPYLKIPVPPSFPSARSKELYDLSISSLMRYGDKGELPDLELGLQQLTESLDGVPEDFPCHGADFINDIGVGFQDRFKMTGGMADLEIAIRLFQGAAAVLPDNDERSITLQNLGIAYGRNYRRSGAMGDLDKSIWVLQEALDIAAHNSPHRESLFHNLAASHATRFQKTGALEEIDVAIQHYQKALDIMSEENDGRAMRLLGLATAYMGKYDRTKDTGTLEEAIGYLEEALPRAAPRDPTRGKILLKLANMYHTRFCSTKDVADLDTSSRWSEEALSESEGLLVDTTLCLYQLSINYLDKYQNSEEGDVADLDVAIRRGEEAFSITPNDYVLRASYLFSISRAYGLRFFAAHSWKDWRVAVAKAQEALDHVPSPILDRLRSFSGLYLLYSGAGKWTSAYEASCTAVTLISRLTPRFLQNSDKQHLLAEVCASLASRAATAASEAKKSPFDAVKLLELGRGVIFNSLHEMRTNISNIRQKHPELVEAYIEYRDKLDAPTPSMGNGFGERYIMDQKLDQVIQEIRGVQGFDQFLMPLSEEDLVSASVRGPIVIINVEHYRCDAFLIQNKQLKTLPLPLLHRSDVEVLGQDLRNSVDPELLEWLWESIAQPVLDELGFRETPSDGCWPRIWWIPTGPLAKFPIHAAGRHTDGSSNTVLDRVISSYSSSARALIYNRRSKPKVEEKPALRQRKAILVSMQQTPGQRSLEFASQEIEALKTLCSSMKLDVCVPEPTRESLLPNLRDCEIFHFAGHGRAHPLDPAKSALILQDRPLTVEDLLQANTSSRSVPFLAYLSACGTGQIKHEALVDEALHLISACQLAGFQHVIGTLWEVRDKSCIDVATRTYKWIEERGVSDESVNQGLHHAVRSLRDAWVVENTGTGAIQGYEVRSESTARGANRVDIVLDRLRRTVEGVPRTVESVEDETLTPLFWCPYVHFGV